MGLAFKLAEDSLRDKYICGTEAYEINVFRSLRDSMRKYECEVDPDGGGGDEGGANN